MPSAALDDDMHEAPAGAEGDPLPLAKRVGLLTGILVGLGLATLASFSHDIGPRFLLLVLTVIAVVNLGPRLLVSAMRLAQIDSEWRSLGVAGMVVGIVASMTLVLGVLAFILVGAGCHDGRCMFV